MKPSKSKLSHATWSSSPARCSSTGCSSSSMAVALPCSPAPEPATVASQHAFRMQEATGSASGAECSSRDWNGSAGGRRHGRTPSSCSKAASCLIGRRTSGYDDEDWVLASIWTMTLVLCEVWRWLW